MRAIYFRWLLRRPRTWIHLQFVPMRQLSLFLGAVFLLFTVIGFYSDLMDGGTRPIAVVLAIALYSGLNAVLWILIVARLPTFCIFLMIAKEIFLPLGNYIADWTASALHPPRVAPGAGIHFAATSILIAVIGSYTLFSAYIGSAGRRAFRQQNELALAHSIQKTLVPRISMNTPCFEIFGISHPSENVGGDLVDVVELSGGDTVAYLADIAGHGLQAGILMGMLKTAARTALTDGRGNEGNGEEGGEMLSQLMARLNLVLPQVKESHMFATFTGLRLNADGQVFFGMAASPPLLHWSSSSESIARIEEEQFPLGLLPVARFPSGRLAMERGDLVLIATDGVLEVCSKSGVEFGIEGLESLLRRYASLPLPELASLILETVRKYGKQLDDQTLLIVRRRSK